MARTKKYVALDVGTVRIGVAVGDSAVRIAVAYDTVPVDGHEVETILEIIVKEAADVVVVGYPRNQSGEPTAQTAYSQAFAKKIRDCDAEVVFQDESLTSVLAEKYLISLGRPYQKGDIDAQAAALILQDYLEAHAR